MKLSKWFVVVAALIFTFNCGAQTENSRVTGVITDPSGASVGGAQVQLTQTATGQVRVAATNDDGTYTIPDLPTGPYELQVKKEGFQTYVQSGIVLQVGSNPTINATLQVGAVAQEVTVTANAAMVETHSNIIGEVVNQQEVLEIPLNARDPMQLLTLTPAALVTGSGTVNNQLNFPNPYTVAFAGTYPGAGTYLLDGGNDNDQQTADSFPLPFPDALQEFKVDLTSVPAQYGMHSSATVNAITKSGTNEFHGDAFEFVRNGLFDARSFYSPVRDPLKRNQFGGVIGGPIKKDKLFFFFALQDTIVHDSASSLSFVPTQAELNGDFTAAASAACNNGVAKTLKAPFVGNKVAPSAYSTPAVNLAHQLPVPTDQACGSYTYPVKVRSSDQQEVARVDYHLNDKHSIFARYYRNSFYLPPDPTNILTLGQVVQHDSYQSPTIGDTYLISNSIVNSFHVSLSRGNNRKGQQNPGVSTPCALGVGGNFYCPYPNLAVISITNDFTALTQTNTPVPFHNTDYQYSDDVEITRGTHELAFGGEYVHYNTDSISTIYENGNFTFSGATTGLAMSDFLLGDLASFVQSGPVYQSNRKTYFGIYGQDSWQLNRKLTVNYGLRWEPFIPFHNDGGEGDFFSFARFEAGIHSKVFPNAPAGMEYPGQKTIPSGDYSGYGNSYLGNWKHFEPRIGLSYDPRGKGREVVRASYGMFYDFPGFQIDQVVRQGSPFADAITLNGVNFTNPYAGFTYNGTTNVDPFPITSSPSNFQFLPGGAFGSYSELNLKAPNLQQWNLSLQKQFGQSWSVTANYIGNHGVHQILTADFNTAEYIPPGQCGLAPTAPCSTTTSSTVTGTQARRHLTLLNPTQGAYISAATQYQDNGTSTYNAGTLSVEKRLSNNYSMTVNYTFSHCIDNGEPSEASISAVWRSDLKTEIGNCSFDRNQQLTINGMVRSPQFKSGIAQAILGNWQVAPIYTALSADWLTVSTGVDTALVGISSGQRANSVPGQQVYITPSPLPAVIQNQTLTSGTLGAHFFNPDAFAVPAVTPGFTGNVINNGNGPITVGPLGNLGRDSLRGAPVQGFDLALTRIFKINERNEIDFRAEAFNLFNAVRYYDPTVTMSSAAFGESVAPAATNANPGYSTPQDPRIMQFALKYVF